MIILTENIGIKDNLSYDEVPVQILDLQLRKLRTKKVINVKVLWRNQFVEEVIWVVKGDMKKRYPHIFESTKLQNKGANPLFVLIYKLACTFAFSYG